MRRTLVRRFPYPSRFACLPSGPARPCSNFRGSRSWLFVPRRWLGCRAVSAPHSSVAVRDRQRRDQAQAQGHRGINGRGPRPPSAARRRGKAAVRPPRTKSGAQLGDRGGLNRLDESDRSTEGPSTRGRRNSSAGATDAASGPPTLTRVGASAADVPPSEATGAAVEPARARLASAVRAARLRAWRVAGVTIWSTGRARSRSAAERRSDPPASSSSARANQMAVAYPRRPSASTRSPATGRAALVTRRRIRPGCVCARDGSPSGSRH
jgi:hypothetical protein